MARKSDPVLAIIHARPPSFLSCASLARELDISESTVYEWVAKGIIPPPRKMGFSSRWCWQDVQNWLSAAPSAGNLPADADPYMKGALNAAS